MAEKRNVFPLLAMLVILGLFGFVYWKYYYSTGDAYIRPLSSVIDKTFVALDVEIAPETKEEIRSLRQRSMSRLSSGPSPVDRLTVQVCECLLATMQKRIDLRRRIGEAKKKKYKSLSNSRTQPEKQKLFTDAFYREWGTYAEHNRGLCENALERMRHLE